MLSILKRLVFLALLALALWVAFAEDAEKWAAQIGLDIDIRAAVLVFCTPVLVLGLFQKEKISIVELLRRSFQLFKQSNEVLTEELKKQALVGQGQFGYSQMIQWIEKQSDSFVQFAGSLFVSRYSPKEMAKILAVRAKAEDAHWQAICSASAFLSKMAPFFGMLATVIGMIHLMKEMDDFSKVSESMGLAMQGTLYGLISFSLLYAPMQKYLTGIREQIAQRNEVITRWFLLMSQQTEATYIQEEMRAVELLKRGNSAPVNAGEAEGK